MLGSLHEFRHKFASSLVAFKKFWLDNVLEKKSSILIRTINLQKKTSKVTRCNNFVLSLVPSPLNHPPNPSLILAGHVLLAGNGVQGAWEPLKEAQAGASSDRNWILRCGDSKAYCRLGDVDVKLCFVRQKCLLMQAVPCSQLLVHHSRSNSRLSL